MIDLNTNEKAVEAVARALCRNDGDNPDRLRVDLMGDGMGLVPTPHERGAVSTSLAEGFDNCPDCTANGSKEK